MGSLHGFSNNAWTSLEWSWVNYGGIKLFVIFRHAFLGVGQHQLSPKSIDRDAPLETFRSYMYLSFLNRPFKTNRHILRTSRTSTRQKRCNLWVVWAGRSVLRLYFYSNSNIQCLLFESCLSYDAFMHSRIYAFTHLRIYAFTHLRFYAFTHLRIYAFTHLRVYAFTRLRIYACTHVRMYASTH